MTSPVQKTGLVSNEPVMVGAFVTWLFSVIGELVVGHTHLVTISQWSSLTSFVVPVVSALVIGAVAWVIRNWTTPAWKFISGEAGKLGIPDATLKKLVQDGVVRELENLKTQFPQYAQYIDEILNAKAQSGS